MKEPLGKVAKSVRRLEEIQMNFEIMWFLASDLLARRDGRRHSEKPEDELVRNLGDILDHTKQYLRDR